MAKQTEIDLSEAAEREAREPEETAQEAPPPAVEAAPVQDAALAAPKKAEIAAAEKQIALQKPGAELQQFRKSALPMGNHGLTLNTLSELLAFSKCVFDSKMFGWIKSPQQAFVAIEMGLECGIPPMQALENIMVINDRPQFWGDIMPALVLRSNLLEAMDERIEGDGENMIAHCTVKRKGIKEPVVRSFSAAQARLAGLWGKKDCWTKYPKRMLQMRARGFALRDLFADVLKGMVSDYSRDEAGDRKSVV